MSKVHVKFFAIFREWVGLKEDWREIEPGTTVQELWNHYTANAKNPRVANIRAAFSVNQRLAKPETILNGGEEVGFLPPVSGGAGRERSPQRSARAPQRSPSATKKKTVTRKPARKINRAPRARKERSPQRSLFLLERDFLVTSNALSLDALVSRVSHPSAGGIATFLGVVRDHANDKPVKFLEYEAYPELAERMLAQIGAEAQERWSDVRIAIAHRVGRLQIGQASVIIAASAPHRAEAFSACRFAIERLKVILPVWKKEFASDTDHWVEGPTAGEVSADKADEVVASQESEFGEGKKFGVLSVEDVGEIRTDLESV